jgi:hypothetical protein
VTEWGSGEKETKKKEEKNTKKKKECNLSIGFK